MSRNLNQALDDCLTSIVTGQTTIEECLTRYPEQAEELRPLLETALHVSRVPRPMIDGAAFFAGKQKMLQALSDKTRRPAGIAGLFHRWQQQPVLRWAPAAIAALFLLIIGALIIQGWPGATTPQMATLEQTEGPVQILPTGSDTWQPASAGDPVKAGDRVATGPLASVTLAFFDGSTTVLQAETKITLVRSSTERGGSSKVIVLRQEVGQTYSRVQPLLDPGARFEIETSAAVASVRGTEFALDVEPDGRTLVMVTEGTVDVTAEGTTISVPAGQMAQVQLGTPPSSILSGEPTRPNPTRTPPSAEEPEPTETPEATETPEPSEPTQEPELEPTQTPKPEPTQTPKPEPTQTPKPEPTQEPESPKPTKKPHPTHPPHPTERPKPTKKPK
jgi:hypothetical protein